MKERTIENLDSSILKSELKKLAISRCIELTFEMNTKQNIINDERDKEENKHNVNMLWEISGRKDELKRIFNITDDEIC